MDQAIGKCNGEKGKGRGEATQSGLLAGFYCIYFGLSILIICCLDTISKWAEFLIYLYTYSRFWEGWARGGNRSRKNKLVMGRIRLGFGPNLIHFLT
jgi:hypothetical protein